MIAAHLAVLLVAVPLTAAPICFLLPGARLSWLLATLTSLFCLVAAVGLLDQVLETGPFGYALGSWEAPLGIELRVDVFNAFVLVIVTAIGAVTLPFAWASAGREIPADRLPIFYCMYLLCLTGLLGMTVTGDLFNLFVFLEISSLSSYVLIAMGNDRQALTAAYRYLIMGTIGATFYLIGVGLLYQITGTLNMADLARRLPDSPETRTLLAAFSFLAVGLSLKLALFPLHFWLPNAYTYAPSAVTVFLASTATKVAVYSLIRVIFTVFGAADIATLTPVHEIMLCLALASMFVASAVAVYQDNLKRLLAYSSIAQIGYMILGMSLFSVPGLAGAIVHLFNHALIKGLLFMALGAVLLRLGSVRIADMAGLGRRMPLTMAAFTLGGLSLIGVPSTAGFISKWALVEAALESGGWVFALLILLSSLIAVVYIWRVVEVAYFRPAPENAPPVEEAPLSMLLPMGVLALANIVFGFLGSDTLEIAHLAAWSLMENQQ